MLAALISRNLKRLRLQAGLTQIDVADRANLSLGHYNKIESLGANVKIETIESIAKALGVDIGEVFAGINAPGLPGPDKEKIKAAIALLQGVVD